jgi:hypothetical protein
VAISLTRDVEKSRHGQHPTKILTLVNNYINFTCRLQQYDSMTSMIFYKFHKMKEHCLKFFFILNQLIIHQVKAKEIKTVTVIRYLNYKTRLDFYDFTSPFSP